MAHAHNADMRAYNIIKKFQRHTIQRIMGACVRLCARIIFVEHKIENWLNAYGVSRGKDTELKPFLSSFFRNFIYLYWTHLSFEKNDSVSLDRTEIEWKREWERDRDKGKRWDIHRHTPKLSYCKTDWFFFFIKANRNFKQKKMLSFA